jgi:hypothetical protein
MKIGCQTYSWEMMGAKWCGSPDDIMDVVAGAGYSGIEFSSTMIGVYWDHHNDLAAALVSLTTRSSWMPSGSSIATEFLLSPACTGHASRDWRQPAQTSR